MKKRNIVAVIAAIFGIVALVTVLPSNPLKLKIGVGIDKSPCLISKTDCSGNKICISRRTCIYSTFGDKDVCDCSRESTAGECFDYAGHPAEGSECGLKGAPCGIGGNPLCCAGNTCVNGRCEGADGKCPSKLF